MAELLIPIRKFPKPEKMTEKQLLQASTLALRIDTFRRSGDVTRIIKSSLVFQGPAGTPSRVSGNMIVKEDTRTKGAIRPFSVATYRPDRRLSTPALLLEYKQRVWKRRVRCTRQLELGGQKLGPPLFLHPAGEGLVRPPLEASDLSDMTFEWMQEAGILTSREDEEAGFRPHHICGAAASKLVNLGRDRRTIAGSRWTSIKNFEKFYFRAQSFSKKQRQRAEKLEDTEVLRKRF